MVEVGQLEIAGSLNDDEISRGFDRINKDFQKVDNQASQANISLGKMSNISTKLATTFLAFGTGAITVMTALATKSPVLAGTMAKIEVATLKLSNTIGRQLKPVFETLAQDLIPSIEQAFADNTIVVTNFVEVVDNAIQSLSNLISLDFGGLSKNLVELSASLFLGGEGTEAEVAANQRTGLESGTVSGIAKGIGASTAVGASIAADVYTYVIDWIFGLFTDKDKKENEFATANGVPRNG